MMRTAHTAEEIVSDFPQPTVPMVSGEPSYETIHIIHNILQENAALVNNNAEGGAHGHLSFVLTPGHYQQVTGHIFIQPAHPGPTPPNPRAFFLQQDLQTGRDNYFAALYNFQLYANMDKALVKQIMPTFDERFYKAIRDGIVEYRNRTVADFLHHMYRNYSQITLTMITKSEANMAKPFNLVALIEDLFTQISNGQDLAVAAEIPYSEMQLVTKAYGLIFKTGIHDDACKEWIWNGVVDKIYPNLQLHFTRAYIELHQLQTAACQAGYSVNITEVEEQDDEVRHRMAEALANLDKDTTTDIAAVANLLESNTESATQVMNMAKQIKEKGTQMDKMCKSIDELTTALRDLRYAPDASAGLGTLETGRKYYCWSHGITTGTWHTGKNCRKQKRGHKLDATFYNRLGGSDALPIPQEE
eukprot:3983478-Ditylum_brightwellii.AAC.1